MFFMNTEGSQSSSQRVSYRLYDSLILVLPPIRSDAGVSTCTLSQLTIRQLAITLLITRLALLDPLTRVRKKPPPPLALGPLHDCIPSTAMIPSKQKTILFISIYAFGEEGNNR